MSALKKILDKDARFRFLATRGLYNWMPDDKYLKRYYKARVGKDLNLENPTLFNEKLQWLKLYNRKEEYTNYVDKYEAKKIVSEKVGEQYVIPTYGVWERFDDIRFDELPDQFVLKCTHDCGGLVICKDKSKLDLEAVRKKIERSLKRNFYWHAREWPYKHVKPHILAEQYMEDEADKGDLTDYKIHCFNGEPKVIQVITGRFSKEGMINDHYYPSWEKLDIVRGQYVTNEKSVQRPQELDELLAMARKLSEGTPYLRTDFYIVNHRIYVGELTFFPASGFRSFTPEKWDRIWGDWITLPSEKRIAD